MKHLCRGKFKDELRMGLTITYNKHLLSYYIKSVDYESCSHGAHLVANDERITHCPFCGISLYKKV